MDSQKKMAGSWLRFFQSAYHQIHDKDGTQENGGWVSLMRRSRCVIFRLFGGGSYRSGYSGDGGIITSRLDGNEVVVERTKVFTDPSQDSNSLASPMGEPCNMVDMGHTPSANSSNIRQCYSSWRCFWLYRAYYHGLFNSHGGSNHQSIFQKFSALDQIRKSSGGRGRRCYNGSTGNVLVGVCFSIALVCLTILPTSPAKAAVACPSYNVFSKLLTDVCWDCMFPVIVAGIKMGNKSKPPGAAKTKISCSCPKKGSIISSVGFPLSMWAPARLVEVVRRPYCFPLFGGSVMSGAGTKIGAKGRMMGGPGPGTTAHDASDSVFYHFHYFAFPLAVMLDLFSGCMADGMTSFDLMYLSELDPTWNDSQLAFFLNPEAVLIANPVAQTACIGDAAASNVGHPSESMFWCAGSWGGLYPLTGTVLTNGDPVANSSLIVARSLAALHRRGLAWKTMGKAAMCGAYIYPTIPKTQYKFEQLYPVAEANENHWIGESPFKWGEWRNIPGVGEDFVHMIWRWQDCCVPFL